MSTLERAIAIAAEAHAGTFDKGGSPYILHPLRVMLAVSSPDDRIVAVLHDVVEDCPAWPIKRLEDEGFSSAVLQGLTSVTKVPGEAYEAFVARAGSNQIGRAVKIADLTDNLRRDRIPDPSEQDERRWKKYERALQTLAAQTERPGTQS